MADQNKFAKLSLQSKNLQCKNLHDYLKTLQSGTLEKLYNHPTTCLAVYRELPEIARHYVIRILFVEQPVPQAVVASWVSQAYAKEHAQVSEVLTSLHVWQEAAIPGGLPGWILNTTFKKYLKVALLGGDEADGSPVITRDGFQFLLLDTASQVWYFILQYLDTVETRALDLVECLTFLFQLSFSTMGKDYSTEGMSEGLLVFLQHLREFGLVYQRKRKAGRFYPTRLALNLASGQSKILTEAAAEGYIVVETNYRVYAYTSSNLQVALVGLFCELLYRFPNLAVGILTRDSVRQALRSGITADQIIGFLRLHAHPRMIAAGPPTLPPTIVDQIKLWENERNRFSYTEGVLYSQFLSQADYEVVRDHAQELGVLIWSSTARRTIIVTRVGHDDVKKFWKRYSKGGG
ncbi:general transcription factor IIH subunit 4 isoform X2 [Schistocerca nitens]|uniref:general transcription factor IIH subunit 4 isoform X2 n=1 Tax=Schistocerca nitens TaxID=7011 RepID=UPI00211937D4|nr:general transcription factor IIH subunit 4 isoform X2 [Schistocerca nitens]